MALCRAFRPKHVIEFGIQVGTTAKLLLDNCPWIERYDGVDLPVGGKTFLSHQQNQVPEVPGELVLDNPKCHVLTEPPGDTIYGMAYIDGDHSREGVLRDSAFCREHVDGVIAWHDYNTERGVNEAIDHLNGDGNRIFLVDGTHVCFRLNHPTAGGILTH